MLDKIRAWGKAAFTEIEHTMGGDAAEQERLTNMRKKLDGANTTSLNLNDVRTAMRPNRRGFAHWFLKPKNGEAAREEVYNDVLQKLAAGRSAGTLLDYEKSWTQMTLRNTQNSEWAGIDPGSSGAIDKRMIEQRLEIIGGLADARAASTEGDTILLTDHCYRQPDPLGLECSTNDNVLMLPCYENNSEPCARLEGAEGAFAEEDDIDLDQLFETGRHQIPWTRVEEVVEAASDHPYSNHSAHWIFEFSDPPATVDINRGKHRIKRVVGF